MGLVERLNVRWRSGALLGHVSSKMKRRGKAACTNVQEAGLQ